VAMAHFTRSGHEFALLRVIQGQKRQVRLKAYCIGNCRLQG
jgi:hypothetical protein